MSILQKIGTELHLYDCLHDTATIKELLQKDFSSGKSTLMGKFNSDMEFEVWRTMEIAWIRRPGGPLPLVYLRGELIPDGNKTKILIQFIPYRAWIPAILSVIVGIWGLFRYEELKNTPLLIVSLLMILVVPFVMFWIVIGQKKRLKEQFSAMFLNYHHPIP